MRETAQHPDDFANSFESAFARLQVAVLDACEQDGTWPARVTTAIGAALEFAAAGPRAAEVLTIEALLHGADGATRYLRMIEHFSDLLRAEAPRDERRPAALEEALVGGIARIVAERLRLGDARDLSALAPELAEFTLLPYLGPEQARRWAGRSRY